MYLKQSDNLKYMYYIQYLVNKHYKKLVLDGISCSLTKSAYLCISVFHSIRFKVNKVGVQRYSFFYTLSPCIYSQTMAHQ